MHTKKKGPHVHFPWIYKVPTHALSRNNIMPASDPKQCVGGQQQKILYLTLAIRGAAAKRRKIVYKTYVCVFCTLRTSRSSAGFMSTIHVVASTGVHQYGSTTRSTSSDSCLNIFVSQAPLQDPCLWVHVSASMCISGSSARSMLPDPYLSSHMYLRILDKIHVFGFMSQHLCTSWILYKAHVSGFMSQHPFIYQDPLQDPCLRIQITASMCISGSSARSMLPDPYLSSHMYLRILHKIHVFGFMSQHLCTSWILYKAHVSGFMSPHPCVSPDPLQNPCLRIHISAAICISGSSTRSASSDSCLRIFVSHGFSARSMSPDSCLSIHLYLRILCKILVSGSMCPIHVLASTEMNPLEDPHLRIHVSASLYLMDPLQDPCLRTHVSASLYLRILCRIHISGSVCKHPNVSQDPLQDPCLRIHVSASICISGSSAKSMSPDPDNSIKIHVSRFMFQHLCISGSSTRSMSPDSCLSIFISQDPLQDPCLWIRTTASICISGSSARSMSPGSCLSIFASQDPRQDPCVRFMS